LGLRFRVWGSGFRVYGFRVWGSCKVVALLATGALPARHAADPGGVPGGEQQLGCKESIAAFHRIGIFNSVLEF